MLAGLKRDDVVGLALVPELLRHPVGLERPLLSPADFAGARIVDFPSRASDSLLRALGATPVHLSNNATGAIATQHVALVEASSEPRAGLSPMDLLRWATTAPRAHAAWPV